MALLWRFDSALGKNQEALDRVMGAARRGGAEVRRMKELVALAMVRGIFEHW